MFVSAVNVAASASIGRDVSGRTPADDVDARSAPISGKVSSRIMPSAAILVLRPRPVLLFQRNKDHAVAVLETSHVTQPVISGGRRRAANAH